MLIVFRKQQKFQLTKMTLRKRSRSYGSETYIKLEIESIYAVLMEADHIVTMIAYGVRITAKALDYQYVIRVNGQGQIYLKSVIRLLI